MPSKVTPVSEQQTKKKTAMTATAGRFVLFEASAREHGNDGAYVTSFDTWDECRAAFPIEFGYKLRDDETGREWLPGSKYKWEAART